MNDIHAPADFLAWAGEIPFLVSWNPEHKPGIGLMTFRVADPDFRTAWAQEPITMEVRILVVKAEGLQGYANRYVEIMQEAHEIEQAYELAA